MVLELEGEARFRTLKRPALRLFCRVLLCAIPVTALIFNFDIPSRLGAPLLQEQFLGIILVLVLAAVFLLVPANRRSPRERPTWVDGILAVLSLVVGGYLAVYYPAIVNEIGELTLDKVVLGAMSFLLVMEACRRMSGWWLVIFIAVFVFYAHYSYLFPGLLNARGISWSKLAVHLYIDPNSLLGTPLSIGATTVIAFILFGQVLYATGGGQCFTDFAMVVMGRFRGGAAKIAILGSALFGMISGSPVANVVMEGSIMIPMMIRTGYRRHVAGAVESVAANGGQLMPPVMGAAAFVMAEFLHVPYAQVAIAAAIPALLYYLALFVQVDLEAGKMGIARMPAESIPTLMPVLRRGWVFIIPVVLILYFLFFLNLSAGEAAFYGTGAALVMTSFRRESRLNLKKFLAVFEDTGLAMLELAVILAVAGMAEGVLTLTGLAFLFTLFVEQLGSNNILLILALTAIVELVLGLPLPTTAVYVLVALTLAPAIVKLGVSPLGAHLFVFYYAMLSLITPPIATTAFAGAAIAGANMMRTGWECMRLAFIAYFIPFVFVFDPLLLFQGAPHLILLAIITATLGTTAVGISMVGYFVRPVGWIKRILFSLGGVGLLIPPGGTIAYSWAVNGISGALCLALILYEWHARKTALVAEQVITAP
ncbi:MAG: TRAP transporter permease [Alphaproteobacteria bacterium]